MTARPDPPPMRWPERPRFALGSELPVPGDGPTPASPARLAMTDARAELLDQVDAGRVRAAFGEAWVEPAGSRRSAEVDRMHRAGWLVLSGSPGETGRRYATTEAGRAARAAHRK